jgi:hypothetical protein
MGAHSGLADYLHAWKIDNFSIHGERVRIGDREWVASECHCGLPDCDGWEIRPAATVASQVAA